MAQQTSTAISYFIAVPGDDQASGIYGIGLTDQDAVADAYAQSNSSPPVVSRDEDGAWTVTIDTGDRVPFRAAEETEARDYAAQKGFIARECTERLYRHIEQHGCDANHFRWTQTAGGLDDLDVDQALVDQAVAEVQSGFEGTSSGADTTIETALQDAQDYVDGYIMDDESVDENLREAIGDDAELRTAMDVAVKKILLDELAEREAA